MKKHRIVEVTWEDHHLGVTDEMRAITQHSVGYYVGENDDVIVIAMSIDEFEKYDEKLTIDKRMFVKKRNIKA